MSETEQRFLIRRGGPLVLVGWVMVGLVLAGCGDRAAPRSARDPLTPEPSSTRPPTATHTPTPPASGKGIPDDFPLALGLVADSETTVGTPRRGVRGVSLEPRCWPGAWPGAAVDRLVVQQSGPELAVTRELAV
ncbi:MAG TPA: hypothetical protein VGK60_01495, partial [Pedococcus sp.]